MSTAATRFVAYVCSFWTKWNSLDWVGTGVATPLIRRAVVVEEKGEDKVLFENEVMAEDEAVVEGNRMVDVVDDLVVEPAMRPRPCTASQAASMTDVVPSRVETREPLGWLFRLVGR